MSMLISVSSPLEPTARLSFPHVSSLLTLRLLPRSLKNWKKLKKIGNQEVCRSRRGGGVCRAELAHDAPFAAAIGACLLTSLVSPVSYEDADDGDGGRSGAIDSTDARFAVMGIISFIPYFNWMSWVFAWLDSGKQRYLVYAVVYLAPYLRTNLSLSPDDSWLPIASILLCIIHIQLEASIKNGDLNDIQFFGEGLKLFSPFTRKEDTKFESHQELPKKGRNKKRMDLPSAQNTRDELGELLNHRNHETDSQHLNEYPDEDKEDNRTE